MADDTCDNCNGNGKFISQTIVRAVSASVEHKVLREAQTRAETMHRKQMRDAKAAAAEYQRHEPEGV